MTNPADVGVAVMAVVLIVVYIALFLGAVAAVVETMRALRTMALELQLMHATIASRVDDLSDQLREPGRAAGDRRPRSGPTHRVRASRPMTPTWSVAHQP